MNISRSVKIEVYGSTALLRNVEGHTIRYANGKNNVYRLRYALRDHTIPVIQVTP